MFSKDMDLSYIETNVVSLKFNTHNIPFMEEIDKESVQV